MAVQATSVNTERMLGAEQRPFLFLLELLSIVRSCFLTVIKFELLEAV